MNYVICISGDGGGNIGPSGVFQELAKTHLEHWTFIPYDTIPFDLSQNQQAVTRLIMHLQGEDRSVYLLGWSLGAVVAIKVFQDLKNKELIRGLILVSPTSNYLTNLEQVTLPVGLIHGQQDQVVKCQVSERLNHQLPNVHELIRLQECDHNYTGHLTLLYQHIIELIFAIHTKNQETSPQKRKQPETESHSEPVIKDDDCSIPPTKKINQA